MEGRGRGNVEDLEYVVLRNWILRCVISSQRGREGIRKDS